jgi:tetratricopeptide (TPR) repeat protein
LSSQDIATRLAKPDPAIAEAHALFRLGQYLLRKGRKEEASDQLAKAIQLHPDSWNMFRQTLAKDPRGLASGPQFWARVDALGARAYYPPFQLEGA